MTALFGQGGRREMRGEGGGESPARGSVVRLSDKVSYGINVGVVVVVGRKRLERRVEGGWWW